MKILIVIDAWELDFKNLIFFPISAWAGLLLKIKKFILSRNDIDTVIFASYDNIKTSRILTNLKVKKIYATSINEIESFLHDDKITDIFVSGMAWNRCVKNRELGYVNLNKFSNNKNILVKDDCVIYSGEYDSKIFDPLDNPDWIETEEKNIYKYSPK